MKKKFYNIASSAPVILIISFILAFGFWLWVTIEKSPIETIVVNNVPVTVNLPQSFSNSQYKIYGNSETTVDITVTGKKYTIQSLTAADFTAVAAIDNVSSTGIKSVPITVTTKSNHLIDYQVSTLSKNAINILVDIPETRSFPVKINLNSDNAEMDSTFKFGSPLPSATTVDVTGPSTELDKIQYVLASVIAQGQIDSTKTYIPELTFKTIETGSEIKYSEFENIENFSVKLPVFVQKELPIDIEIKSLPEDKEANISLAKETIVFWIPTEKETEINKVYIKTINYNELTKTNNQFALSFDECEYEQVIPLKSIWCAINIVDVEEIS